MSNAPKVTPFLPRVREDAGKYAEKIFANRNELNQILIWIKWTKHNVARAQKLLLEACPDMLPHHHPDLEAWQRAPTSQASGASSRSHQSRDEFFWPYINLEDLTKQRAMLLFLHFHVRNQPHKSIYSDLELARLGYTTGIVKPGSLDTAYFDTSIF